MRKDDPQEMTTSALVLEIAAFDQRTTDRAARRRLEDVCAELDRRVPRPATW